MCVALPVPEVKLLGEDDWLEVTEMLGVDERLVVWLAVALSLLVLLGVTLWLPEVDKDAVIDPDVVWEEVMLGRTGAAPGL